MHPPLEFQQSGSGHKKPPPLIPPQDILKEQPPKTIARSQLARQAMKVSLCNKPVPHTVIAFHVCYRTRRYQTAIFNSLLRFPISSLPESHVFLL